MSDVRGLLREALGDARPSPSALEETRKRIGQRERRRRGAAGAVAIVVAVAALAFAYDALRPDRVPTTGEEPAPPIEPSPIPPLTGDPRITAEISWPRGVAGGGLAVGAGSAWVGFPSQERVGQDSVGRIDLETNEIVAEVPVASAPSRKRIAATDDAVWVASTGMLERIDPATNAIVARVEIPDRSVSAIAADATAVWAVTIDTSAEGILVRVDPATNQVVAEVPLGPQIAGYEDDVQLGAGSVWVLGIRWFERENAEYGSDLIRVDPELNAVVARIPVGGFHMVVSTDHVWVRFPEDGVFDASPDERWLWTRVDAQTNEQSEPFRFEADGLQLVTGEALWAVGYDEQEHVRVTRFDPETLEVVARSEPIRSYYHDAVLDATSATVWVSAFSNIVRLDIA